MTISFLNPFFLFGLAAGILPILIHRLTKRKASQKKILCRSPPAQISTDCDTTSAFEASSSFSPESANSYQPCFYDGRTRSVTPRPSHT